ncbi:acetamidase/formamidase family protein [Millisia brevis]|uniref:acetamidase/formamidase family protein n=1 Tax=Millisia brevis TaxID=264148 RepID=UPI0008365D09|nr:acetamidase/formamidase family protein [Millisia brevis]
MTTASILQPKSGPLRSSHYLRSEPDAVLWGRLPGADDAPIVTIADGAEITIDTVSHEGLLPDQGSNPVEYFGSKGVARENILDDAVAITAEVGRTDADGPHVVSHPIAVEGARPGDLLRLTLVEALPRVPYGVVSNRHGRGALPGEFPRGDHNVSVFTPVEADGLASMPLVEGGDRVVRFPINPFLGLIGVTPAEGGRLHSVPPGPHGGNIDIRMLTAGASILLPVQVPGANFYVGDPHFAQGDGEVALTALEASLRVTVRAEVVPREQALLEYGDRKIPFVETADAFVPTGLDPDLDAAVRMCVREAIDFLGARYGMEPHLALAYLSAAVNVNVSQVVDQVCGAHAAIPRADFAGPEASR